MVQKRTVYLRVSPPRYSFPLLPALQMAGVVALTEDCLGLGPAPSIGGGGQNDFDCRTSGHQPIVPQTYLKTAEKGAATSSLTPCILDDDPAQLEMLAALITDIGYEPITTSSPEEALKLVQYGRCRLVLADVHMPGTDGYAFLDHALRADPGVHVIIMTGDYTLESALEAVRRGATDFLPKPIDRVRLKRTLDDVAALYDQRRRARELEEQLLKDLEFHGIVGKSPAMLEVFDFARKVARHYTNVLLIGATGTGKELVARAIHQISPVSQQKLAVCNCSALVDTLLESQLFGHMR
jgi:DNA-binding NtrC family response regulator